MDVSSNSKVVMDVLFNGSANAVGLYSLYDNIMKYDQLKITMASSTATATNIDLSDAWFTPADVVLNKEKQFVLSSYYCFINFSFTTNSVLRIDVLSKSSDRIATMIAKVVGVKF